MEIKLPKNEEKILKFWKERKIFEKSLKKTQNNPRFIFYEGPPFANGLPGIHHLLARAFKDIILRYKTMQGFFVERKAGWDTHGLPTEMEAEKKLGIKTKKEIEKLGIEKFIEECKDNVFTYKKEWEEFTQRIGFWLDLKNAYITCSNDYIESLWWILKQIWQKKLLYQDYKVVPYCPRCATSLSSHEVAQGYRKIVEPAIFLKLKIKNPITYNLEPNTYLLVWTTTPWTLPGNVAVAVNPDITYVKIKVDNQYLILAKERIKEFGLKGKANQEFKGQDLLGLEYESLFSFTKPDKKAHFVVAGDFVSTEEGTGLVHIAPAFGEEDMELGKKEDLPILMNVDQNGCFKREVKKWAGMFVKKADPLIVEDLKNRDLLFKEELYEHDYPFCWRCDTPLLYYAKTSWFIKMTAVKEKLLKNNEQINWLPEYLKEGRFGEWLREVKDWNLSRERYWGTPLPVWHCQTGKSQISNPKSQTKDCGNIKVIGSINELKKLSGKKITDLHRPFIDKITFRCDKCGGEMRRVPEVIDCWFDSGSMPFAQWHYPFENKERIEKNISFPADFICEGIDQTRGWFYTLLAVSTLLGRGTPYKNVISHGLVLDAKGQKMSKSRGNVIWPKDVIDKYGADVARFYFYTINPVAEPKKFDFKDLQTLYRKFFDTLNNVQIFFLTYRDKKFQPIKGFKSENLLDRWILSRLESLNLQLIKNLDNYEVVGAARLFIDFVDGLSNWYVRRSRRIFQKPGSKKTKEEASQTLYFVLLELVKLLAPFCPFISEKLYHQLLERGEAERRVKKKIYLLRLKSKEGDCESVHLTDYPKPNKNLIDRDLERKMAKTREIAALALAERAKDKIKVRQPLSRLKIKDLRFKLERELLDLIKEEVNVKEIIFDFKIKEEIELDTKISEELKEEGQVREFIRQVQQLRKNAKLTPKDKIIIYCECQEKLRKVLEKNKKDILAETRAKELKIGKLEEKKLKPREIKIDNEKLNLVVRKVVKL